METSEKLLSIKQLFLAAGLPGYLFYFRNILYFFITRRRSLDEYSSVDNSALLQIIFVLVIFIVSVYMVIEKPKRLKIFFSIPQIFLIIYIIVCFISMLWTPNLFVTGYRAFESLAYLLLISLIAYNLMIKLDPQNIIEWAILWIIWELFWKVATAVKLGAAFSPTILLGASRLAIPLLFFFALLLTKRIYFKYVILVICIFSASNKIYFGIVFGLLGFFFGNSKYKGWLLLFILSITVIMLFVDVEEILKHTLFYGREAVSLSNTSGRDQIWKLAWEAFLQKPLLGYGFVDGETVILYNAFNGAISTHNFLFSGLLGTGLLGTVFLILYFWSTLKKASSNLFPANKFRPAMVSTFIMGLIVSSTAPGVGARVYGSWIPVVLIFTLISSLHYQFKIEKYLKTINSTKHENYLGNP